MEDNSEIKRKKPSATRVAEVVEHLLATARP
jgi:hypothetical protein